MTRTSDTAPSRSALSRRHAAVVETICRTIETSDAEPKLDELARAARLSVFHLHRLFKSVTGVTPKAYASAARARKARASLDASKTVTEALHDAGYGSSSRFYEKSNERLGMTPTAYKSGGKGLEIRFAVGQCSLGSILVAATARGVCAIFLGDDPETLCHDLERCFSRAVLIGGDSAFEALVARVVGLVEDPSRKCDLPLDIRGTAFQERVWRALTKIPAGTTTTYSELARRLAAPAAVRAVAGACANNRIAVAIPCHRVVRRSGELAGYRWGIERKRALLAREAKP